MPLSNNDFRFGTIIGEGATSVVCEGFCLLKSLPPARVAIKILSTERALEEASQYLLVDGGLGNFLGIVSLERESLPDFLERSIQDKFEGPISGLILKHHQHEPLLKSTLIQSLEERNGKSFELRPGEWIIPLELDGKKVFLHQKLNGDWSFERRVKFIESLIRAVRKFHACGHAHGDLSPKNVLLENDEVSIIDYGGNFTAGTPGWSMGKRLIEGDISSIGLWIQRVFDGISPKISKFGEKVFNGHYAKLSVIELEFNRTCTYKQRLWRRSLVYLTLFLTFALTSIFLKEKFEIDYVGQRAIRDVEYRDEALPELRRRFLGTDQDQRKKIWPYLVQLSSKSPLSDLPADFPQGLMYFQGQACAIYNGIPLQIGDLWGSELHVYDISPSRLLLATEKGRIKRVFTQNPPFDQIHFGVFAKRVDLEQLIWALCQFDKREFINLNHEPISFSGALTGSPEEILNKLTRYVNAENKQDFTLFGSLENHVRALELPMDMVLPYATLKARIEILLEIIDCELEMPSEFAHNYLGRKRLKKTVFLEQHLEDILKDFQLVGKFSSDDGRLIYKVESKPGLKARNIN